MNNGFIYTNIMLFSVFISCVSQIILKKSALINHENSIKEYLNPYVFISYSIFLLSTFITIYALKHVPLSKAPIIESTGYIHILILSRIFLKEKLNKEKVLGISLILMGVYIFTL